MASKFEATQMVTAELPDTIVQILTIRALVGKYGPLRLTQAELREALRTPLVATNEDGALVLRVERVPDDELE